MESEDQFYLTLPSSASMDLYPRNTISDFTTELLNNINLEREMHEVGLSEIILDADVENVPNHEIAFVIYRSAEFVKTVLKTNVPKGSVGVDGKRFYQEVFYTKRGLYDSLAEVMAYFNIKFIESRMCRDLVFHTSQVKEKHAEIICLKSTLASNLKPSLAANWTNLKTFHIQPYNWFGRCVRATNNVPLSEEIHESSARKHLNYFRRFVPSFDEYISKPNFTKNIYFVCDPKKLLVNPGMAYVYSDIVDHQYVGNTKAPLLRIVHFDKTNNVLTFPHVHYLPISKTTINSIRIYVRNVEGNSYPFTEGTAMYKIHIRKKNI